MLFDKIDISFQTKTAQSLRVFEVAEAFGLGLEDDKPFDVLKNFEIDIRPGDIVYLTGDSGGGKSLLLRKVTSEVSQKKSLFGEIAVDSDLRIDPQSIVIESIGESTEEAITFLSYAGMNDAYLFLRKYAELSDGQKYRYKIAKMLDQKKQVLIFDEFCSVLDRETAKAVAFTLQKIARRKKLTLIVATAHDDLIRDLSPSVLVRKHYGREADVAYLGQSLQNRCSLMDNIEIHKGTREEWSRLEAFHYRDKTPFGIQEIYIATLNGEVIAGCTYSVPARDSMARNRYFGRKIEVEELNKNFANLSRVVVVPKFRGIGLGVRLLKETLPMQSKKYVESIAVMTKFNPFVGSAGMKFVGKGFVDPNIKKRFDMLNDFGFEKEFCASAKYNLTMLQKMSSKQFDGLKDMIKKAPPRVYDLVVSQRALIKREDFDELFKSPELVAAIIRQIAILAQEKTYYIYEKPSET